MSLRDDICAQRAAADRIDRELADLEKRLRSRNTAYLLNRARGHARIVVQSLSDALRLTLEEAPAPAEPAAAAPERVA